MLRFEPVPHGRKENVLTTRPRSEAILNNIKRNSITLLSSRLKSEGPASSETPDVKQRWYTKIGLDGKYII